MIDHDLNVNDSILIVRPTSSLAADDFVRLAKTVDPHIEATGGLRGLVVETKSFPGWESFAALMAHLRFVRDHHKFIKRVAVVTDSKLGNLAEKLASHFVAAEIKHFPSGDIETARQWILQHGT